MWELLLPSTITLVRRRIAPQTIRVVKLRFMESIVTTEVETQRLYYAETARQYNPMHVKPGDEHFCALCIMLGAADFLGVKSILDIGSGTGRVLIHVKQTRPDISVNGIEPVRELREIAYADSVSPAELLAGDALQLPFRDSAYDMVCEFGVLHHIRRPELAIEEMLRVAKKAVFISDSNNFGQGSFLHRSFKQVLHTLGLWPVVDLIKTCGRGYTISEGDGLAYSYSVFTNYKQIRQKCKSVHIFNTTPAAINPYRTAGHVALLGIRQ